MSQLKEDLIAARAVIENPEAWTKGWFAKTATGLRAHAVDPTATCWCALGAVRKAVGFSFKSGEEIYDRMSAADDALDAVVPEHFVPEFNDDDETTHADILAAFDRAIAAA